MAKRIALAIWKERISPLFDASRTLLVVDIDDGRAVNKQEVLLQNSDPVFRARELEKLHIHLLICGAISKALSKAIEAKEIQLIPFTAGDKDSVIASYLDGTFFEDDFRMPGYELKKEETTGGVSSGSPIN